MSNQTVAVTGLGIVSPIGHDIQAVRAALWASDSGIQYKQCYNDRGFQSQVAGTIDALATKETIARQYRRFMGDAAAFAHLAMQQAIRDANLSSEHLSCSTTGLVIGTSGVSTSAQVLATADLCIKGIKRIGPYIVPKTMANTVAAALCVAHKIKGVSYAVSSACATGAHCIGNAMELIQSGRQNIVFAGGAEEEHWVVAAFFDAMGALSSQYNNRPTEASRPFDQARAGFVVAGGAGVLVLESLEHAKARQAKIYATITGYGATADGADMVSPSGIGAIKCMQMALESHGRPLEYINAHATGTPIGDKAEIEAIRTIFGKKSPPISSTKSQTGHTLGAAGAHEAIYSLIMMQDRFLAPSINIDSLDPDFNDMPIIQKRLENQDIKAVMTNSFGFGGTNASLIFSKYPE